MVERASRAAGFDMKIHLHMLRHSCGYKLADDHPAALSNRLLGPDCFWDYLLAESAARRHADLLCIGIGDAIGVLLWPAVILHVVLTALLTISIMRMPRALRQ